MPKETGLLSVTWSPGLDPRTEKDRKVRAKAAGINYGLELIITYHSGSIRCTECVILMEERRD